MKRTTNHVAVRAVLAVAAACAVTMVGVTPRAAAGSTSAARCSAAQVTLQPPDAPGPWLDIQATGLASSRWYSVFAITPTGWTEGVAVFAGAGGSLETTALAATAPGQYTITVNRFHTKAVITGCGISVG